MNQYGLIDFLKMGFPAVKTQALILENHPACTAFDRHKRLVLKIKLGLTTVKEQCGWAWGVVQVRHQLGGQKSSGFQWLHILAEGVKKANIAACAGGGTCFALHDGILRAR